MNEHSGRPMTLRECMELEDQAHSCLQCPVRDLQEACAGKDRIIKRLRKGIARWASECAECDGKGTLLHMATLERSPCPACADIRKLLK
jgi:DnaJ-class molecular chaperone